MRTAITLFICCGLICFSTYGQLKSYKRGLASFENGHYNLAIREFSKVTELDPLYQAKDPWNVNALAQIAGMVALEDKVYQRRSRTYTRTEINYLYEELETFDKLKVYEPTVNFILVNIEKTNMTANELKAKLLEYGIAIRNCENYPGLNEYFVRFANS